MRPLSKVLLALVCTFYLQLALHNLAGAANATSPPREEGKLSAVEQARALLVRAQAYRDVQAYDLGQKEIIDALKLVPDDKSLREKGIKLWREVDQAKQAGQRRKNMAELDEAARLSSEGKTSEAASKASQVLGATNDETVVTRARRILKENHPTLGGLWSGARRDFFTAIGWVISLVEALVILAVLYVFLRVTRKRVFRSKKDKWWLGVIDDKNGSNIADFVMDSFRRWRDESPSATAGLLRLGALQLPSSPSLEVGGPEFDVAAALESLKLQIGTVSVASVAKVVAAFRGWWNALRPAISGAAFGREAEIVVHLVQRSANGDTVAVSASAKESRKAAEAASYQMYYLIAKQTSVADAELADKLRQGLGQLNQYISGRDPAQLQAAYEIFRDVIREKPTYEEASLYEGVALDLLERHDEAISRFAFLAKNATDSVLREKAMYNEAVSYFRKYTAEDLNRAIEKLNRVIGEDESTEALTKAPIKALAYAAKANAMAHRFLFWQDFLYKEIAKDSTELTKRKEAKAKEIEGWLDEIATMISKLEKVHRGAKSDTTEPNGAAKQDPKKEHRKDYDHWDAMTLRQLSWAIKNAQGNAYLNCAIGFYKPPDALPNSAERRRKLLDMALAAFQECEVLLPAGVETLTNLAATLLNLSKREEARAYAERAIALNPNYEYAYYRLAQSWVEENRKDETVKVLNRFPRAPRIPGFKELFNRYYVEPKSA